MDPSRRKFLASAGTASTLGLAGCLDPDEGTGWDIWLGGDEPDEDQPGSDHDSYDGHHHHEHEHEPDQDSHEDDRDHEPFDGFCDTRFRVPKQGRVYFSENPELTDGIRSEGVISDDGNEGLEIQYLNQVKYLGDEAGLSGDTECFDYTPGGLRDVDYGDWHSRCFEIIHEYDDSYLVETQAIKDVAGPDERSSVPICIYDSDR